METERRDVMHSPDGEGKTLWIVGTDLVTFKATGEDPDGAYALFDSLVLPGGGPPRPTSTTARSRASTCWRASSSSWRGTIG